MNNMLVERVNANGRPIMFLTDLIKKNGHELTHYTQVKNGRKYESVFNYSNRYGGTFDSFKFYNDYVVDTTK
jgi:hypothetical protein